MSGTTTTSDKRSADRRESDRRKAESPIAGKDRRKGERRSPRDRRVGSR